MADNESNQEDLQDQQEQTLMDHLIELRDRLLHMVLAILIVFVALFAFSEDIFTVAAEPLLNLMPEGTSMIATGVTSPFLVPFKLVLLLSVLLTIPYLLHQIWAFIAPGLYHHEKRLATPLLISSVILFYCGIAFAYFVIFPILFGFFIGIAPEGVAVMTDIGQYLDFIIAIFLAFGIAFEVPVATFLLIAAGVTSVDKLATKRPYIIIGAFVVGMLLTPPDVISQSLLAIPIWLLFELGLIASRIFLKEKEEENVIMENDEFSIVEEVPVMHQPDIPEDDHDEEGRPLTDDEMEALLDEMEQEEADNNSEDDEDKDADSDRDKNKPADK
ncbi:MAG: twin-arginine translocase subunit TatC [Gammaproteobacteria bacterium]|nr:twin-arginine translocase subunit TatC [Gammaproteobacteria bacterium]NNJ51012.1 twin-arginine translocase subunit TatC [Gammaproteobacteria bacterium]